MGALLESRFPGYLLCWHACQPTPIPVFSINNSIFSTANSNRIIDKNYKSNLDKAII
jgi:hypothetical protein